MQIANNMNVTNTTAGFLSRGLKISIGANIIASTKKSRSVIVAAILGTYIDAAYIIRCHFYNS